MTVELALMRKRRAYRLGKMAYHQEMMAYRQENDGLLPGNDGLLPRSDGLSPGEEPTARRDRGIHLRKRCPRLGL